MAKPYRFLRAGAIVFKALAWLTLVFQVVTGLFLVLGGGGEEPMLIGGLELPTRILGLLNFIAAGVYFFSFWMMASIIRLLLDVRERLPGG